MSWWRFLVVIYRSFSLVPFLHHLPIHNPPQRLQMRGAAILVVEVVGMLPNVKRQQRLQTLGDRVVRAGLLSDNEGTVGGGGEPDPAGAEEGDAFGD